MVDARVVSIPPPDAIAARHVGGAERAVAELSQPPLRPDELMPRVSNQMPSAASKYTPSRSSTTTLRWLAQPIWSVNRTVGLKSSLVPASDGPPPVQ